MRQRRHGARNAFTLIELMVVMVILGILAVVWPQISTVAVDVYVGWLFLLSGIVGIVAGILLISGLPGTATWAIGVLAGINFLFSGWSFIAIPVMAKNA